MYRSQVRMTVLAVLTLVALAVVPAVHAQAFPPQTHTWVSGVGNDANPCTRTAPCRTFAGAISQTRPSGEISVLDPSDFGTVTITKSITINGDGTLADILANSTHGIIIDAGATDKVIIRNVSINGAGHGMDGVLYVAGGQVTLENVTITGMSQNFTQSRAVEVSLAASGKLVMNDVTITNCGGGVRLTTSAGTLEATLDNVRIQNNDSSAFEARSNTVVTIKQSNLSHNDGSGVLAAASTAVINVEDSVLAFNSIAVNANVAGSLIRISNNTIVNNFNGVFIKIGASVESAGNNRIAGSLFGTMPPNEVYDVE